MSSSEPVSKSDSRLEAPGQGGVLRRPGIVALLASQGLGGGVEAVSNAMTESARSLGCRVTELALTGPDCRLTWARKVRFLIAVAQEMLARRGEGDIQVIALHPSLLPCAFLARLILGRRTTPLVLFHGDDIWRTPRCTSG